MQIIKTLLITIVAIALLALAAYGAVQLYHYVIQDATAQIKQGVREGVSEGVDDSVGSVLNPLNIPKKIFGFGRK